MAKIVVPMVVVVTVAVVVDPTMTIVVADWQLWPIL